MVNYGIRLQKAEDMTRLDKLSMLVCKKAEDMTQIGKLALPVCKKAEDMTREKQTHLYELGFCKLSTNSNN